MKIQKDGSFSGANHTSCGLTHLTQFTKLFSLFV